MPTIFTHAMVPLALGAGLGAQSPIGVSRFFTARGAAVFASEFFWVWLPCAALAAASMALRRRH